MHSKTMDSPYRVTAWEFLSGSRRIELKRTNAEWDAHFRDMRDAAIEFRARQRKADAEKAWR